MIKTFQATFDGKVFRPEGFVDLEANGHYLLTIKSMEEGKRVVTEADEVENDPAFNLSSLAVKTGISDLAAEHDHYLYGTPKRNAEDVR